MKSRPASPKSSASDTEYEIISPLANPKQGISNAQAPDLQTIIQQLKQENAQLKSKLKQFELKETQTQLQDLALARLPEDIRKSSNIIITIANQHYETAARLLQKAWLRKKILRDCAPLINGYQPIQKELQAAKKELNAIFTAKSDKLKRLSNQLTTKTFHSKNQQALNEIECGTKLLNDAMSNFNYKIKQQYPDYIKCLQEFRNPDLLSKINRWTKANAKLAKAYKTQEAQEKTYIKNAEHAFKRLELESESRLKIFGGSKPIRSQMTPYEQENANAEFLLAVERNNPALALACLKNKGADINAVGKHGLNALMLSLVNENWKLAWQLIEANIDLTHTTSNSFMRFSTGYYTVDIPKKTTCFQFLIINFGFNDMQSLAKTMLTKCPALLNTIDETGNTPLMNSMGNVRPNWTTFILDYKPNVTIKNNKGLTAIDLLRGSHEQGIHERFKTLMTEQTPNVSLKR